MPISADAPAGHRSPLVDDSAAENGARGPGVNGEAASFCGPVTSGHHAPSSLRHSMLARPAIEPFAPLARLTKAEAISLAISAQEKRVARSRGSSCDIGIGSNTIR
jgi:hypothetical protein